MDLDAEAAYAVLKARDARFDGRLFVGVTSTGVYCRPVCRVRTPRRENCRFFATRAQAEAAAFRPCMKCRPEIAPGLSLMDSSATLAQAATRAIEHAVRHGEPLAVSALAARLGVSARHLQRIFRVAHGVAPHAYLTTQRLLLAKQLLTDTRQPVTQVALASGFDSLRRFNAAFAARYRLNPTQLRRSQPTGLRRQGAAPPPAVLKLAWRPPYDTAAVLDFLSARALNGIEQVEGTAYRRTLSWPHRGALLQGWLQCTFVPERNEVHLQASDSLQPALGALLDRARHVLDLDADPATIDAALSQLPVPLRRGTRLVGSWCGFELAVRVILGQQVAVKAARTLVQRVVMRFGTPLATPFAALTQVFPSAAALAAASADAIGELGIVRQRVKALQALATAVAGGHIVLAPGAPLVATLTALRALPGIGEWTAQLIAMRALAWPDAWPASDVGLINALPGSASAVAGSKRNLARESSRITALAEPWRPWRAYAVMRLWHHLEHPA